MFGLVSIALLAANPVAAQQVGKTDVAEKSADPRDKIICKRFVETGSLVRGYRTCKTKADWDRERDNIRAPAVTQSCMNKGGGLGC